MKLHIALDLWGVIDTMTGLVLKLFYHEPSPSEVAACLA